ncbi:MAG: redox-sensing transcriptional repressor Rex [Sedimentisphaerales bacterium]
MRYSRIPNETVRRLPIYLRGLAFLARQGLGSVSSGKLADFVNVNAWQIRKDFSYFGDFGTRGVGYNVENLARQIKKILNLDVVRNTALVGAGNLGTAVLAYPGFETYGFRIEAAFDNDPAKIGRKINNVTVEDISRLDTLGKRGIDLAIIAVPEQAAQQTADLLVGAGIKGILNFSPRRITVPKKVKVITIDIATDLARLPYYIPSI